MHMEECSHFVTTCNRSQLAKKPNWLIAAGARLNSGFFRMERLGVLLPSPPPWMGCSSVAGYSPAPGLKYSLRLSPINSPLPNNNGFIPEFTHLSLAFCQVAPTIHRYPFILPGGERHCEARPRIGPFDPESSAPTTATAALPTYFKELPSKRLDTKVRVPSLNFS